jgi:acyl carrier protein
MSKNEEIKEWLIEKVKYKAKKLQVIFDDEISGDFSLTGSGIFDSMDFMVLIADVESAFNVIVDFSDSEPEKFTTINGFLECIKL